MIDGRRMIINRWSLEFDLGKELVCTPVWINLPGLCVHLQNPSILKVIGGLLGKYLCMNQMSRDFSRPSVMFIYVELNLLKTLREEIKLCWMII
jgi:hypothetical protein